MKAHLWALALALGLASFARAADISTTTVQDPIADWALVQAEGGIELGPAIQHSSSSWKFNLTCDLSAHASGLIIKKTRVEQGNGNIYISFVVSHPVWTLTPERGQCQPVIIDSYPGVHLVYYRDASGKTYPLGHEEFIFNSELLSKPSG